MSSNFLSFPKDFLWGAATSSFQIEGHPLADGAAKSNWYEWTKTPGRIVNGDDADMACDHYHRYESDVDLMKEMGLMGYRFSLSWPRIVPERGRVNERGIDFYRRLIEKLHKTGITPCATLFHWEVPIWAEGGWENRETALAFREYAEAVFQKLGKDVPFWATHNEPVVVAQLGYMNAYFPPGKSDKKAYAKVVHHLNLAHGLALQAYRQLQLKGEIGWVLALSPWKPSTQEEQDVKLSKRLHDLYNGIFLDPAAGRGYPDAFFDFTEEKKEYYEKDLKDIAQPLDFLGVNHYFPSYARFSPGKGVFANDFTPPKGMRLNDLNWPVVPDALYDLLTFLWKTYGYKKIYVTENGIPTRDTTRSPQEILEDDIRVHFYGTYLAAAHKAIQEGVPLKGYYAWSFMDNFEWCHGYDPRFGLVHVDFKTQKRTFKKSAKWYQKVIADKGFDMAALPKDPPYRVQGEEKSFKNF